MHIRGHESLFFYMYIKEFSDNDRWVLNENQLDNHENRIYKIEASQL